MSELSDVTKHVKGLMGKAVDNTRRELATIRSGKASTSLLDTIKVDAYGQSTPLSQVAGIAAPEPRLLTVQPWDKSLVSAIEKAIQSSDLGLNPANDGTLIRIPIPQLTEERRRDLVKVIRQLAEEGKIAIRHARTDGMSKAKKVEHVSDDDKRHEEKDIQKVHDDAIKLIDDLVKTKEEEIMEV